MFRVDAHKNLPHYWEAYCAAFLGETPPVARNAAEQYAVGKGTQDGSRRKVVSLASERRKRRAVA